MLAIFYGIAIIIIIELSFRLHQKLLNKLNLIKIQELLQCCVNSGMARGIHWLILI